MAERLEIAFVIKKSRVAMMRPDVVNVRGHRQNPLFHALNAERMLSQETVAQALPLSPVTASGGRASLLKAVCVSGGLALGLELLAGGLVLLAKLLATRHRTMTTGIAADDHQRHGKPQKKNAQR